MQPRAFEELVASLIERMGYQVKLTPYQKDDGVDIFAVSRHGSRYIMTVIDCKRYAPSRPIDVGMIRTLAGVRDQHHAQVGMMVTTSRFTRDATNRQQERWPLELSLVDGKKLLAWLEEFGWQKDASGLYIP